MLKHKPATALPWSASGHEPAGYGWIKAGARTHFLSGQYTGQLQDAAYIAHAANAYPKLVEALRAELTERNAAETDAATKGATVRAAYERERGIAIARLLREIGEDQ